MLKRFLRENKAQAVTETIIFFMLVYVLIAIAIIYWGLIQLCRERIEMANSYLGYTYGVAETAGNVEAKTKAMLRKGAPSIYIGKDNKWIDKLGINTRGRRGGEIESQIVADFKFNSRIVRYMAGRDILRIRSNRLKLKGPRYPSR